MNCESRELDVDLYLDGELGPPQQEELEAHFMQCGLCARLLAERLRERRHVNEVFAAGLSSTPGVPLDLEDKMNGILTEGTSASSSSGLNPVSSGRSRARTKSIPRILVYGMAASLVVLAVGFVFFPQKDVNASPLMLLSRANDRYQNFKDVELWIRVESQALTALEGLFGKEKDSAEKKKGSSLPKMRLFVDGPSHLLYQTVSSFDAPRDEFESVTGFDGVSRWSYDPEDGFVLRSEESGLDSALLKQDEEHIRPDNINFIKFFSWDFMRDLSEEENKYVIEEITWPSDRRAARRVFRITRSSNEEKNEVIWAGATVTIDPVEDLIEKMVIDLSWGPVSILSLTMEVARIDAGLDEKFFDISTHVPPGTPVKMESEEDKKKEEAKEKEKQEGEEVK